MTTRKRFPERVLLTKEKCPKCETLKGKLAEMEVLDTLPVFDATSTTGMAYAAYVERLKGTELPMLVDGKKAVVGVINIIRYLSEVKPVARPDVESPPTV